MKTPSIYLTFDPVLKPFSIGLSALDPDRWLEPDDDLQWYVEEKARLAALRLDEIYYSEPSSLDAQEECLEMIVAHLAARHGQRYDVTPGWVRFANKLVDLSDTAVEPLMKAGSLVADDLVILEKRQTGWHLVAGHVAFPSAWSLKSKAGLPMEGVHAHVPGFESGTRNAVMINRIFDNLQPDLPATRLNWSIYPSGELFWPPERNELAKQSAVGADGHFIRVERQTLRRLPKTGAIVFTIRIYTDALAMLKQAGDGRIAEALTDKLLALSPEQLVYKGMLEKRDALVAYLSGAKGRRG